MQSLVKSWTFSRHMSTAIDISVSAYPPLLVCSRVTPTCACVHSLLSPTLNVCLFIDSCAQFYYGNRNGSEKKGDKQTCEWRKGRSEQRLLLPRCSADLERPTLFRSPEVNALGHRDPKMYERHNPDVMLMLMEARRPDSPPPPLCLRAPMRPAPE